MNSRSNVRSEPGPGCRSVSDPNTPPSSGEGKRSSHTGGPHWPTHCSRAGLWIPVAIWSSRADVCALAAPPGRVSFPRWISCLFWRVARCLHCLGFASLSAAGRMVPFFPGRCQTPRAWDVTWDQGRVLCERPGVMHFARTVGQDPPARKDKKLTLLYGSRILHTERDIFVVCATGGTCCAVHCACFVGCPGRSRAGDRCAERSRSFIQRASDHLFLAYTGYSHPDPLPAGSFPRWGCTLHRLLDLGSARETGTQETAWGGREAAGGGAKSPGKDTQRCTACALCPRRCPNAGHCPGSDWCRWARRPEAADQSLAESLTLGFRKHGAPAQAVSNGRSAPPFSTALSPGRRHHCSGRGVPQRRVQDCRYLPVCVWRAARPVGWLWCLRAVEEGSVRRRCCERDGRVCFHASASWSDTCCGLCAPVAL